MTAEERLKRAIETHEGKVRGLQIVHDGETDPAIKRAATRRIKELQLVLDALRYALNFVQGENQDDPDSD